MPERKKVIGEKNLGKVIDLSRSRFPRVTLVEDTANGNEFLIVPDLGPREGTTTIYKIIRYGGCGARSNEQVELPEKPRVTALMTATKASKDYPLRHEKEEVETAAVPRQRMGFIKE